MEHPAPFPEDIVHLPILMATKEGDLLLDPLMGYRTIGRVSNAHRRFLWDTISNSIRVTT